MSVEASTVLGPYRLEELVGRGGMGEVYRAFATRRQRRVALKLLPESLSRDEVYRERFRRESLTAAGLSSPHVVPIHDFGQIAERLFIDMRLIAGLDLGHVVSAGPMEPRRAVEVLSQVAEALDDAHRNGIVHRDVKPSNVLLTDGDFAYLLDFGIAHSQGTAGLTETGTTVGTFGYMAPERLAGTAGDARVDVYSLACVVADARRAFDPMATSGVPLPRTRPEDEMISFAAPAPTAVAEPTSPTAATASTTSRTRARVVAGVAAVLLLALGAGLATALRPGTPATTAVPDAGPVVSASAIPAAPTASDSTGAVPLRYTFRIAGTAKAANINFGADGSTGSASQTPVPWSRDLDASTQTSSHFATLSAFSPGGDPGTLTCTISDQTGRVISTRSAASQGGQFGSAMVNCSG